MKRAPADRDGNSLTVLAVGTADAKQVHPVGRDIATFLHPVPLDRFQQEYMHKSKALAIKVHPRLRERRIAELRKLFSEFNPSQMLEESNSENISVWMRTQEGILHQIKANTPEDARKCYDAGHSLYFRGNEEAEAAFVPSYSQQLGFAFPWHRDGQRRGEIETFATQIGHETSWHMDFQENFTVQLRGAKRWSVLKSTVQHPHRAYAPHFNSAENAPLLHTQRQLHTLEDPAFAGLPSNADGICETVTLQAGDVLYHPPGLWHKVETIAAGPEPCNSLSINISLFPMTWGEYLLECIQQQMLRSSLWRSRVHFSSSMDTAVQAAAGALAQLSSDVAVLGKCPAFLAPAALVREVPTAIKLEADGSTRCHGGLQLPPAQRALLKPDATFLFNPLGVFTECTGVAPKITAQYHPPGPTSVGGGENEESSETGAGGGDDDDNGSDEEDDVLESVQIDIEPPKGYTRFDYCANFAADDAHARGPAIMVPIFAHKERCAEARRVAKAASARDRVKLGHSVAAKELSISPEFLGALLYLGCLGVPN